MRNVCGDHLVPRQQALRPPTGQPYLGQIMHSQKSQVVEHLTDFEGIILPLGLAKHWICRWRLNLIKVSSASCKLSVHFPG